MSYDPVGRHKETEARVIQKKVGGDLKKYSRFRHDRWYGGIITADCVGCGLTCRFCWVRDERLLSGESGENFFSADQVAETFLRMAMEKKIRQVRISGGEPLIGKDHLLKILNALQHKKIHFILETNGILLGEDESYARDLALFSFVHVRVSLKGASEGEFARLTGADPKGFQLQLAGLNHLVKAGVSVHPAVMASFSEKESMDKLYNLIWKINPRMQSEIEREEVILYPHVIEKLKTEGIRYNSGHRRVKIF
ncbi:MAG: molybdenum cofactor biosynthesis protein [Deltaproteobacteria bacterium]|nr:molybdenum cofactor biosynthesis protein [Deltaproteobacteria bacterium]MBP1717863.1 molybdenum cofactor biosynthesis protein [Deltaproteobacteria bacterium]